MGKHNDFNYAETDKDGMKCPIAAHIRRSNPRDTFTEDAEKSIAFARKHRLMRRGRSYGVPFVPSLKAEDILLKPDDGVKRGLYFVAINANFGRQFNFIQQAWISDGGFQGLSHEPDVLLGGQAEVLNGNTTYFSMPQETARQRIKTHEAYIHVRGSMNFFLPSLRAVQWIADLPTT
jgi:deferrochelatase/peroxidase EfeB